MCSSQSEQVLNLSPSNFGKQSSLLQKNLLGTLLSSTSGLQTPDDKSTNSSSMKNKKVPFSHIIPNIYRKRNSSQMRITLLNNTEIILLSRNLILSNNLNLANEHEYYPEEAPYKQLARGIYTRHQFKAEVPFWRQMNDKKGNIQRSQLVNALAAKHDERSSFPEGEDSFSQVVF